MSSSKARASKARVVEVSNTIPSAARRLGIGEGTLRRAIDRQEIAVVSFGGLRRITNSEIERVRNLLELREPGTAS